MTSPLDALYIGEKSIKLKISDVNERLSNATPYYAKQLAEEKEMLEAELQLTRLHIAKATHQYKEEINGQGN
jgi:hypothetical protein